MRSTYLNGRNGGPFLNLFQSKGGIARRHRLSAVIVLTAGLLLLLEPASAKATNESAFASNSAEIKTLLFFDDQRLNQRDNVERHLGKPELLPDSIYRDPHTVTAWGYPTVFFDAPSGKWRMLYLGWTDVNLGHRFPLLAESDDGLHWVPRDTTREIKLADRKFPHQVLPLAEFSEWPPCYVDERAAPAERIKGLVVFHSGKHDISTRLWVSPDGIKWKLKEGVEWQKSGPDPGVAVFWNAVRESYTFITRPDWTDRRIAVFETRDWVRFTEPELALQTDALDAPLTQLYGMPVFPYAGYYVAFLWLYHTVPQVKGQAPHKFIGGHVDCQLAYSLNGWHFQRGLRTPFIGNGAPGEPTAGCVYPSSLIQKPDGSLWIYASAGTHEHAIIPPGSGSILTYKLRRDGFVYLESANGTGTVGTVALLWKGGELEVNAQSPNGRVRVRVTDPKGEPLAGYDFGDCEPLTGDETAWQPKWKNGKTMGMLGTRTLRLEIELTSARLYALRGRFTPLVAGEVWRFNEDGTLPRERPGF